jgi:hypothetical protein
MIFVDTTPVLGLFKSGRRDHIEEFVRGTLYMNTLEYFAQMEEKEDNPRYDSFEGVGAAIPANDGVLSIKIGEDFTPLGHLFGTIKWRPTNGIRANVFCMYALRPPDNPILVGPWSF